MEYVFNATGDCVTGDQIRFQRAIFTGSFRSPKFSHLQELEGIVVSESYGAKKGQHTFTILLTDGTKLRIKGRNLYRYGVKRAAWLDEDERKRVAAEKHARGDDARAKRERD